MLAAKGRGSAVRERRLYRADPAGRVGIAVLRDAQQVLGLVAKLTEVRSSGKVRHDISLHMPVVRERDERRSPAARPLSRRWTRSCPRTRRRPPAPDRSLALEPRVHPVISLSPNIRGA